MPKKQRCKKNGRVVSEATKALYDERQREFISDKTKQTKEKGME